MESNSVSWLQKHFKELLAVLAGVIILVVAWFYPQWWGDRSLGVLIGVAVTVGVFFVLVVTLNKIARESPWILAWVLVIVPVATALILRRPSGQPIRVPLAISIPPLPSAQSILIVFAAISFLVLLVALARSLARGEVVSIESHWGGLGGGIGGWRISSPMIYLLGLVFLLVVSCAVAWRVFPPRTTNAQSTQTDSSKSPPVPSPTQ